MPKLVIFLLHTTEEIFSKDSGLCVIEEAHEQNGVCIEFLKTPC